MKQDINKKWNWKYNNKHTKHEANLQVLPALELYMEPYPTALETQSSH